MESLLLGGDDSSSGESDTEQNGVAAPTTSVSRPATVGNTAVAASSGGSMSQSEMAQRLKSMYSPASKVTNGAVPQAAAVTSPQVVAAQPHGTVPLMSQQQSQHQTQQGEQPLLNPSSATNYRPTSSSGSAPQQQQRGVIHQQHHQRSSHPHQQQIHRRPSGGMPPQQQSAPVSSIVTHPSEPQHQRPLTKQMQPPAPSMQQRPTSTRLPHQQQSGRHIPHNQTQTMNAPPNRSLGSNVPGQPVQQVTAPRSSGYGTSGGVQILPQQIQQTSAQDRAVMEKKHKERFLVFTRVLMVRCCDRFSKSFFVRYLTLHFLFLYRNT
jgi:hypothetical protein